jgi:hypothetical protein
VQARQPRCQDRDFPSIDAGERFGRAATTGEEGIPFALVGHRDQELEGARVGDEGFVERRRAFRDQAEGDLALQKQRIGGPAAQRDDRVSVLYRQLPWITRGRDRLRKVDDDRGRKARILLQLIEEVGLQQLQRAVGIARLRLGEVRAADSIVRFQYDAKILLGLRIGESDSRPPVVEDDYGSIGEHDFGEEFADGAAAPSPQRMDVAHTGAMQDERVDAALAYAPLQCARPLGERGLFVAGSCHEWE